MSEKHKNNVTKISDLPETELKQARHQGTVLAESGVTKITSVGSSYSEQKSLTQEVGQEKITKSIERL
ncbi:MAG: hypothetical protein ISQ32_02005 [Rickettsiales bacterium]|nr:hypothetical protein [Rickettsiales bacterium]